MRRGNSVEIDRHVFKAGLAVLSQAAPANVHIAFGKVVEPYPIDGGIGFGANRILHRRSTVRPTRR